MVGQADEAAINSKYHTTRSLCTLIICSENPSKLKDHPSLMEERHSQPRLMSGHIPAPRSTIHPSPAVWPLFAYLQTEHISCFEVGVWAPPAVESQLPCFLDVLVRVKLLYVCNTCHTDTMNGCANLSDPTCVRAKPACCKVQLCGAVLVRHCR